MGRHKEMMLVADIGGTKTDVITVPRDTGGFTPAEVVTFSNRMFSRPEDVLDQVLHASERPVTTACIAVAGPVEGDRSQLTNLGWSVDAIAIAERYGLENVVIVNDARALGHALPRLQEGDCQVIATGTAVAQGTKVVMSPGTGLGVSFLVWHGGQYTAYPAEAGHLTFAPVCELERALVADLLQNQDCVQVEDLCSGPGIQRIFAFLARGWSDSIGEADRSILALPVEEQPPFVAKHAQGDRRSPLCEQAMTVFCRILARVASDFAAAFLAKGGVYLAGAIPRGFSDGLICCFSDAYQQSASMRDVSLDIPAIVVKSRWPVLLGAYWYARSGPD